MIQVWHTNQQTKVGNYGLCICTPPLLYQVVPFCSQWPLFLSFLIKIRERFTFKETFHKGKNCHQLLCTCILEFNNYLLSGGTICEKIIAEFWRLFFKVVILSLCRFQYKISIPTEKLLANVKEGSGNNSICCHTTSDIINNLTSLNVTRYFAFIASALNK